jgi:hypothetical protein
MDGEGGVRGAGSGNRGVFDEVCSLWKRYDPGKVLWHSGTFLGMEVHLLRRNR